MPHVDGSIDETKKQIAKTAIDILTMGRGGFIAELIKIINFGDSVLSLTGTKRQQQRIIERIGGK